MLKDASGSEVAKIQERKLSVRDKMKIEMGDRSATVHKAMVGIRDRYKIDIDGGPDLSAHGNVVDHEYKIEQDGDTVATVSKAGSGSGTPTASRLRRTKMMRSSSRSRYAWTRWRADSRPASFPGVTSRGGRLGCDQIKDAIRAHRAGRRVPRAQNVPACWH